MSRGKTRPAWEPKREPVRVSEREAVLLAAAKLDDALDAIQYVISNELNAESPLMLTLDTLDKVREAEQAVERARLATIAEINRKREPENAPLIPGLLGLR